MTRNLRHPLGLYHPVLRELFDAWHDAFESVPWLIHKSAMAYSKVCHDSFKSVPRLIQKCAMTHSNECHESYTRSCVPTMMTENWMIHRRYMRTFEDTRKYEMRPESDADPYTYTLGLSNPDSLHILYSLPDQIKESCHASWKNNRTPYIRRKFGIGHTYTPQKGPVKESYNLLTHPVYSLVHTLSLPLSLSLSLSHTHTYTYTRINIPTYTCKHTDVHTRARAHTHTHTCTHEHTHTHTHTRTRTHARTHAYTRTHTHTYTPRTTYTPCIPLGFANADSLHIQKFRQIPYW